MLKVIAEYPNRRDESGKACGQNTDLSCPLWAHHPPSTRSPAWKLSNTVGFGEALLCRHDQLIPLLAPLLTLEDEGWGQKSQAPRDGLAFLLPGPIQDLLRVTSKEQKMLLVLFSLRAPEPL